jgi:transposase-like protein
MGRPTRRTFTLQQKFEIVMQLLGGEKQLTALAREHGVDHTTI